MASTNAEKNGVPPGKPVSLGSQMLDKGAQMLQSLTPIKQMSQHACTFALYSQDMSRQIETHHFVTRINQDFLQCAVYDSDDSSGRLIGVEYIVSDRIFDTLPLMNRNYGTLMPTRVPETVAMPELENLAKYHTESFGALGKQIELPIGPPSLMMSPQDDIQCMVKPELVKKRDDKYNISTNAICGSRTEVMGPGRLNPMADYWREHNKCLAVDVENTEMKKVTVFP
ncbi:putative Oil body-associated protein [Helianthus annuus]|nr:putative Oil body-associated protein [Helianthus annuus]